MLISWSGRLKHETPELTKERHTHTHTGCVWAWLRGRKGVWSSCTGVSACVCDGSASIRPPFCPNVHGTLNANHNDTWGRSTHSLTHSLTGSIRPNSNPNSWTLQKKRSQQHLSLFLSLKGTLHSLYIALYVLAKRSAAPASHCV